MVSVVVGRRSKCPAPGAEILGHGVLFGQATRLADLLGKAAWRGQTACTVESAVFGKWTADEAIYARGITAAP